MMQQCKHNRQTSHKQIHVFLLPFEMNRILPLFVLGFTQKGLAKVQIM